jgi:hypothetical protein
MAKNRKCRAGSGQARLFGELLSLSIKDIIDYSRSKVKKYFQYSFVAPRQFSQCGKYWNRTNKVVLLLEYYIYLLQALGAGHMSVTGHLSQYHS